MLLNLFPFSSQTFSHLHGPEYSFSGYSSLSSPLDSKSGLPDLFVKRGHLSCIQLGAEERISGNFSNFIPLAGLFPTYLVRILYKVNLNVAVLVGNSAGNAEGQKIVCHELSLQA